MVVRATIVRICTVLSICMGIISTVAILTIQRLVDRAVPMADRTGTTAATGPRTIE
jgi:hypothetical protein